MKCDRGKSYLIKVTVNDVPHQHGKSAIFIGCPDLYFVRESVYIACYFAQNKE